MCPLCYYVLLCPLCAAEVTLLFLLQKKQSVFYVIIKPIRECSVSKSYNPVASITSILEYPGKVGPP